MIGSEALPFSKTGGLADVLGALPGAVVKHGWQVTLVVPRYRGITAGLEVGHLHLDVGGYHADIRLFEETLSDGVRVLLVDEPHLYDREAYYTLNGQDYPDNPRRFGVLVRAALESAILRGTAPTIVHAHDWQAGLAPVYLRTLYREHPLLAGVPSVFTIHNLLYQGVFEPDWLPRLDLQWSLLGLEQMEFWGKISFLKGGINFSSTITTVSPQYAREIQTPAFGVGFDGILRHRSRDLVGILNGIDAEQWNPSTDPLIPQGFTAQDLSGKRVAKEAVLGEYGLPREGATLDRPLIGMISRMVDQKGLDLIAALAHALPTLDASFVILGTGDEHYQNMWRQLAREFPGQIGVRVGFDEGLAHRIEAGADIFLMPSRFEPCGLNQMYSLRYGTIPIVRRVGGLADTVVDADTGQAGNGVVFEEYTPAALWTGLNRARSLYGNPVRWRELQTAGMAIDHSWDRSAREYVKIYERLVTKGEANGSGERADLHGR